MLVTNGIKPRPSTAKNPQSNAIVERLHKTVADMIRNHLREIQIDDVTQGNNLIDSILASAAYAYRATVSTALGVSPAALVYHRDMQLNVPIVADYALVRAKRQARAESVWTFRGATGTHERHSNNTTRRRSV